MPHRVANPVLPGFHPDPSLIRVGEDYYLANSSFEYFPGIPLFHSRDLAHWRPIGHALTRASQLDLKGVPDSGGLWAPSISHHDGKFYLVVCNVRTRLGPFKDMRVMMFTADHITGPWSDGVRLPSWGFDPSLYHEGEKTYLVNIQWDYRKGRQRFAGIFLQEIDRASGAGIGERSLLLHKVNLMEGPNLYLRDGWYYLLEAEGGTSWNHSIAVARSRSLRGPYEVDPKGFLITSRAAPGNLLQKAGHGELVSTPDGQWALTHLASRPLYPERRCVLGRETCMQRIVWEPVDAKGGSWPRLASGTTDPAAEFEVPEGLAAHPWTAAPVRDRFAGPGLGACWQTLREPADPSWLRTGEEGLTLVGRESLVSLFSTSMLLRRLESFRATVTTRLRFEPAHFTQSAGLVIWYDSGKHYYLRMSHDEVLGPMLGVVLSDDRNYDEHAPVGVRYWPEVHLRAEIDRQQLTFHASPDGRAWRPMGPALDMTRISDDYGGPSVGSFTGAMVGLSAQDLNGAGATARFDYFDYLEG